MMTEERQGRAGRWYDDWTDCTVLTTRSETKNEVACNETNEQPPESLTGFDSMQITFKAENNDRVCKFNYRLQTTRRSAVFDKPSQSVSQSVACQSYDYIMLTVWRLPT